MIINNSMKMYVYELKAPNMNMYKIKKSSVKVMLKGKGNMCLAM